MKRVTTKSRGITVKAVGGPFDGKTIRLGGTTLLIRVGDFVGSYDIKGKWHEAKQV